MGGWGSETVFPSDCVVEQAECEWVELTEHAHWSGVDDEGAWESVGSAQFPRCSGVFGEFVESAGVAEAFGVRDVPVSSGIREARAGMREGRVDEEINVGGASAVYTVEHLGDDGGGCFPLCQYREGEVSDDDVESHAGFVLCDTTQAAEGGELHAIDLEAGSLEGEEDSFDYRVVASGECAVRRHHHGVVAGGVKGT